MVKRLIFGLIWTAFGITMLCLRNTFLLVIVVAGLSAIATYEFNHAIKLHNKPVMVLSLLASVSVPFYYEYGEYIGIDAKYLVCLYILALCICLLVKFETTRFSQISTVVISSLGVPYAITLLIYLRDIHIHFPKQGYDINHGLFLILFAMFCAWISDVGAYFAGRFFGKHKLAPNISPKKTVEGAVGGVVLCVISTVILYAVFTNFVFETSNNSYLSIVLLSAFLSIIGICGDLTASVIKRNYGIKDFGKLIPGHGGIMDRFDSIIFVLVALYAIFNIFGVVI